MSNTDNANARPKRPTKMSLGEVRRRILADESLSKTKRLNTAGALVNLGKAFKLPMEQVNAEPKAIGETMSKVAAAELGLGKTTWATQQSLVRFALRHVGILNDVPRRAVPFAPAWTAIMALAKTQGELFAMSRFARFCSSQGIDPESVGDPTFSSFLADIEDQEIVKGARKVHRRAAKTWNELANTTRGWPSQLVTVPSYSRSYALSWDSFPPSLKADVDAHLAALDGSDPFNVLETRTLKPRSIDTRRHQLHVLISGMVLRGETAADLKTLADVTSPGRVRTGLMFLLDRAGQKQAQAHDVAQMALSVARYWVKAPEGQLKELSRLVKRLHERPGMTKINRDRLRQIDNPKNVRALLTLPATLVSKVRKNPGVRSERDARMIQTALMIELLLMTAMRLGNLTNLDMNRHFIRAESGSVYLTIEEEEVKNESRIDAELLPETIKLLNLYIKTYRPLLAGEPSSWLFPGRKGRAKCSRAVSDQICDTIRDEIGLRMHVHLFRHVAAKLRLDSKPGSYGIVQRLLGHKSINTTMQIYTGMETRAATHEYNQMIEEKRR